MTLPRKSIQYIAASVCLFVSLAVRSAGLDQFGLWDGEVHTVFHSARPLAEFVGAFQEFTAHPPVWFVITHYLLQAEANVWLLRFPALLAGVLSVAAGYGLARKFLPVPWALLVMGLLAVSPLSLRWSQSVRMYTAFMLLSTLSFYFLLNTFEPRRRWAWLGYAAATLLNLHTHYFAMLILFSQAVFLGLVLLALVIGRRRRLVDQEVLAEAGWLSAPRPWLRRVLAAGAVVGAGYLPWFLTVTVHNFIERQTEKEVGRVFRQAMDVPFLHRLFQELMGSTAETIWLWLILAAVGLAYLLMSRRHYRNAGLIAISLLTTLNVLLVIDPRRFHAKYLAFFTPLIAILVVAGAYGARNFLAAFLLGWARRVATIISAGLLVIAGTSNLWWDYQYFKNPDCSAFAEMTEPAIWCYRGPWPEFIQRIEAGGPGFLLPICSLGRDDKAIQQCATYTQVGAYRYLSPGLSQRLVATDWKLQKQFEVWWVVPATDTGAAVQNSQDPRFPLLGGIPLGTLEVAGPNQELWHTHLNIVSVNDILLNGSFESGSEGWQVISETAEGLTFVDADAFDGFNVMETGFGAPVTLASYRLPVEPGTFLQATMMVRNLALTYHATSPTLAIEFSGEPGADMRSLYVAYSLPSPAINRPGWQQVTLQALTPNDAQTVRLMIAITPAPMAQDLAVVDDVHLFAIRGQPWP